MDDLVFASIMRLAYPQFQNLYPNDVYHFQLFKRYFFFQKVLRINGSVPWPVDFRSQIINWKLIKKDKTSYPGGSLGCYINASGGLQIGQNVIIGPNTIIATTNHDQSDHSKTSRSKGVTIGNNVWIGANCSIVPGADIGDDVTVGAGCYVRGKIPASSVVRRVDDSQEVVPKTPSDPNQKTS
jgi:acetyltransferase-like isoleucine patch superfamily enzyme